MSLEKVLEASVSSSIITITTTIIIVIIIMAANNHKAPTLCLCCLNCFAYISSLTLITTLDTLYCCSHFEDKEAEDQEVK